MDLQILWAGLEVLGPKDDVEEKEREKRKKNKVLFFFFLFLFFYAESSIPSVTVPATCTLTECRNNSLVGMK